MIDRSTDWLADWIQVIPSRYASILDFFIFIYIFQLHEGHSCAYLPWGGKEYSVNEYDVLVWQKHWDLNF